MSGSKRPSGAPRARADSSRADSSRSLPTAVLTALLLALAFALPTAPSAHAADKADGGYRYWSFWLQEGGGDAASGDGSWSYATEGPATQRPEDGDTLGFRFALSEDSRKAEKPRGGAGFDAACAGTSGKSGSKRVALRLDFGTGADAAKGAGDPPEARTECARVDENATAATALAAVSKSLRYSSDSLLCAIDGYPAKGCGEQVADGDGGTTGTPDSSATAKDKGVAAEDDGGDGGEGGTLSTGLGVTAGVAAVAVLGAAALWQARRRRQ